MEAKNRRLNQQYWNDFYKNNVVDIPSQFCVYVATDLTVKKTIFEFGSGSGRDAFYFANQGYEVVAIDRSREAVQHCRDAAASRSIEHAFFV